MNPLGARHLFLAAVVLAASSSPLAAQRAQVVREVKDAPVGGGTPTVRVVPEPVPLPRHTCAGTFTSDAPPVFVVNGRIVGTPFGISMADIDPNDIKSIEVLKGPRGVAEYGPEAEHGAVLITTKRRRVLVP